MIGLNCMAALVFNFFSEPAGYSPKLKDVCFDLKADVNGKVWDQEKILKAHKSQTSKMAGASPGFLSMKHATPPWMGC